MHTTPLYLVPTFHYDVAYLKPYAGYLPDCFKIIREALTLMARHPDYHFLIEQVILLDEYWQHFPEDRDLLRRFAAEGRLDVAPGMWVMPDMNHPSAESLYQQTLLGKQWLREHLDLNPRVCWVADCWGHHAQLPQILRDCGYDYYVFWRCMRRDVLKNDFIWRGLDGTTINTHWLARGYANMRFPTASAAVNAAELTFTDAGADSLRALLKDLHQYGPNETLLVCNGGDMALPQASAPRAVETLRNSPDLAGLQFASPVKFLNSVHWPTKSTVDGEFNSSLQGTFTSNIRIKQLNRELTQSLVAIDALAATLRKPLDTTAPWRLLCKQQFHDIICGTITDAALTDCYNEFAQVRTACNDALASLADGQSPALFNPLSWPVTRILNDRTITLAPLSITPLSAAKPTTPRQLPSLPSTFENSFYHATINAQGYITSLLEKSTNRELASSSPSPFGALTMQMDYGDLWLNFDGPLNGGSFESSLTQNTPDPFTRLGPTSIVNGQTFIANITAARVITASDSHLVIEQSGTVNFWQQRINFTMRITFASHTPRIEYQTQFTPQGRHYRIRVAFPTALQHATRRDEIAAGTQVREVGEHVAQHWCDYSDASAGFALLNRGTPGSNVADNIMLLTLFRAAAMEYKTQSVASFNQGIPHTFDYAIVPHAADLLPVIHTAHEFNTVYPAVNIDRATSPLFAISAPNIIPIALRQTTSGTLLRVYESLGRPTTVTITLPANTTTCHRVNGLLAPLASLPITNNTITLTLRPYEIAAILTA